MRFRRFARFARFARFPSFPRMGGDIAADSIERLKRLLGIAETSVQRDEDNNVTGESEPKPSDGSGTGSTTKDM